MDAMKTIARTVNKRVYGFLALMMAVGLMLGGCANVSGNQASAKGGVTLYTASMLGEGDSASEPYQTLIADFMQKMPVFVLDESEVSSEEWKAGIVQRFAQDETTPDVLFYFTGADAKQLILNDEFVTVEEIQAVYPQYAQNIRPSAMNFIKEFDENHYSVPVRGFWEGLFCNKDLFDQYGVPLPDSWESLTHAVKVFAENGVIPIAASMTEVPHYWIEHVILAQGGAIEHRLNPSGYVPDSWVAGLGELKKLYDLQAFPKNTMELTNVEADALFADKKAAMVLEGSWISSSIKDKESTVVLPVPKTPTGKKEDGDIISGFSSGYYITRNAWNNPKKRDAAVQFVLHMTSNESIAYMCEFGGAPAADLPASDHPTTFANYESSLQSNSKNSIMPIDSRLDKEAWKYLCQQIQPMLLGQTTPLEIVTEVSKRNKW